MGYTSAGYYDRPLNDPEMLATECANLPAGLVVARGQVPPGIMIIRGFLERRACQELVAYADSQAGVAATVQDADASWDKPRAHRSDIRVTDHIDIGGVEDSLIALARDAFVSQVGPYFGQTIEWIERPALLRYQPGGYYVPHADAENWDADSMTWRRAVDRDFSLLLYLDDQFEGGELDFPNFRFKMKPQAGLLVCFPADHRFVHEAATLTSGRRHVVVSWAAARGTERVLAKRPPGAIAV